MAVRRVPEPPPTVFQASAPSTPVNGTIWVDSDSDVATFDPDTLIGKSLINAAGDLLVGSADDTVDRLPLGSNGYVLTVDTSGSGVNKVKWAAVGGGKDDADNIIAVQVFG